MELARHEADMDLLEFMEVEASDKATSASSSAGTPASAAADSTGLGPGRPRKRRREQPPPNTNNRKLATTTTIIIAHDTHDKTTTSTSSTTSEELECVAHAAEAVVVGADGGALGPEGGPPRLVDYPDSEGADEADLDGRDSEATELPDEAAREDEEEGGDEGGDDGGDDGAKESDTRAQEGDEDSEMTQSMDMEEMHARVVIPDTATSGQQEAEEKEKEKGGKEERSEERKNERDERAGEEPGRETAANKHEQGEAVAAGAGGELERRAKGDKAKRRLPDWMVLTPKQLQQAQAEKEREMRESKAVLREQALRFFEIMQCSNSSTPSESSGSIVDDESAEQLAAGAAQGLPVASPLDAKPLIAVAPVTLETKVLVSDTVRYTDVLLPIEEGRVVIFDLETSGFGADDSIIEIGAVELIDGQRTGIVFQSYAKAMGSINPYAFKAHGLSEEVLSYHQSIEIVLTNFMRWVGHSPLVAHNSRFDMRMLCQELRRWDIPMHGNKVFCTLRYYRAKYPGMAYSLDDLASHFRIDQIIERRTHGALVDAEICARVYQKFLDAL